MTSIIEQTARRIYEQQAIADMDTAVDVERRPFWPPASCPREFFDAGLAAVLGSTPEIGRALLDWASATANAFETASTPPGNLVLTGSVGAGKTFAAWAVVRLLTERLVPCRAWTVYAMLNGLRYGGGLDKNLIKDAPVLFVDDMGATRVTEFEVSVWNEVLDFRRSERLPTIVATNLSPAQVTETYGERISDRLLGGATLVPFSGPSRRRLPWGAQA